MIYEFNSLLDAQIVGDKIEYIIKTYYKNKKLKQTILFSSSFSPIDIYNIHLKKDKYYYATLEIKIKQ